MNTLLELQEQYYEEFKGLPGNRPVVRNNQKNDAFELVVLKVLYGKKLPEFIKSNVTELSKYIIAPPDAGIDIFYQHEDGDECSFDIIQVKNSTLDESELRNAILGMKRTIDNYCKNPKLLSSETCKEILSNSNLDKTNKRHCNYYVVHTGNTDDLSDSEENEHILTLNSLNIIYNNTSEFVEHDTICIGKSMQYGNMDDNHGAMVCTINGLDLANLNNTYYSTEVGRNILFGSNLRESLITKKSKPYRAMSETIINCPENFWYYNNGITIIAKEVIPNKDETDKVLLKNFSIVNGAQTTSTLGLFLKEAKKNHEQDKIEALRKVYVLARILKVSDEDMRKNIAIYNNAQNPITPRDMIATRTEQKELYKWLMNDTYPQIFAAIKRGSQVPSSFNKGITHRITSNEELAQLAYASFLQKPSTAKDKKSALFNNDYSQEYVINKIYHDIFYFEAENSNNNGILFRKTKTEIDEVLFVRQMYKEAKRVYMATLTERVTNAQEQRALETNIDAIKNIDARIAQYSLWLDITGICMFYYVALYYEFKAQFDIPNDTRVFNFDRYYSDKDFKKKLVEKATDIFLTLTVKIIANTAIAANKAANVNNWVRNPACEGKFFEALRMEIAGLDMEQKYNDFIAEFKVK